MAKFQSVRRFLAIDPKFKFDNDGLKDQAVTHIEQNAHSMLRDEKVTDVYSIPYEFVGHKVAPYTDNSQPPQYRCDYPDWYRITPAYSIHYSGMTPQQHLKSLCTPRSSNFVTKRISRWVAEDSTVIFCDKWDKMAMVAKMIVLVMTALLILWQMQAKADCIYTVENIDPNTADPEEMKRLARAKKLSEITNSSLWRILMLAGTIIPSIISFWNIYKRTTIPAQATKIENFISGRDRKVDSMHDAKVNPSKEPRRTMVNLNVVSNNSDSRSSEASGPSDGHVPPIRPMPLNTSKVSVMTSPRTIQF